MPRYEPGRYFCRITNQALGKASTGNPQIVFKFLVVGKMTTPTEYAPVEVQEERTMFLTITDKTAERIGNDLETIGFQGTSFRQIDPNTANYDDLAGVEFQAYCKHEEYNGKDQEKWSVAKPGGGMPDMKPLEAKELRDLDNLFGKHIKKAATARATPTAMAASRHSASSASNGEPDYSDVPPPTDADML